MIQNAKIAMRKEAAQSQFYRVWGLSVVVGVCL